MRRASRVEQRSEIGVDRHQDPAVVGRPAKQSEVTGIRAKRSGFEDIVALVPEPCGETASRTSVDQEPHGIATRTPSI